MKQSGHLVIVGGAEDRRDDMVVLQRFADLLPPGDGPVLVLTSATDEPEEMFEVYRKGFRKLGVKGVQALHVDGREVANDPEVHQRALKARGIFMTGGDQTRLLAAVSGTRLCDAMRHVYIERGACIAGTSAGASALSEHMLGHMPGGQSPSSIDVSLNVGLGFVLNAVIDQHFSQRGRLSRLLAVVAHNPKLMGVGIDENTALVIARGRGIEVIGEGAVTLVDGREMRTSVVGEGDRQVFMATDVRLHFLPAGSGFLQAHPRGAAADDPGGLSPAVRVLVQLMAGLDAVDTQFRADD